MWATSLRSVLIEDAGWMRDFFELGQTIVPLTPLYVLFADDPQQAGDEAGEGNPQVQLQTGDGHAVSGAWQVIFLFKVIARGTYCGRGHNAHSLPVLKHNS